MQRFLFCVVAMLGVVLLASAQEFVWAVPQPVIIEARQPVANGTVTINYQRDGDKIAFTRVMIEWYGNKAGSMVVLLGNSGITMASRIDNPTEWDANGDPVGGEIREAILESMYEGVPFYYSRRAYNADSFDGVQPFEKYIKRVSKNIYLEEAKVLGKLIQMVDVEVAMLDDFQRRGLFQKETEVLVKGFLGLYQVFRDRKIPLAVFTKDEDPLAVQARGRKTTAWATLKKRE